MEGPPEIHEEPAGTPALPAVWRRVMTDPHGFFAEMPETGGLQDPILFLAACAAVNAAGHLLLGWGIAGAASLFVTQVVGAFVAAALLVLVAQHLFEGRAGFEATFRVVAYAAAPTVVLWVPLVGGIAWIYRAYLALRGVERVHALDTTRAVLTVLLAFAGTVLLRFAMWPHRHWHHWHW
jgi:hypothetical protein